jgi:hypothetical protein
MNDKCFEFSIYFAFAALLWLYSSRPRSSAKNTSFFIHLAFDGGKSDFDAS